jgi:hypothetical protein
MPSPAVSEVCFSERALNSVRLKKAVDVIVHFLQNVKLQFDVIFVSARSVIDFGKTDRFCLRLFQYFGI